MRTPPACAVPLYPTQTHMTCMLYGVSLRRPHHLIGDAPRAGDEIVQSCGFLHLVAVEGVAVVAHLRQVALRKIRCLPFPQCVVPFSSTLSIRYEGVVLFSGAFQVAVRIAQSCWSTCHAGSTCEYGGFRRADRWRAACDVISKAQGKCSCIFGKIRACVCATAMRLAKNSENTTRGRDDIQSGNSERATGVDTRVGASEWQSVRGMSGPGIRRSATAHSPKCSYR
ncbi:hypothetical protein C2E23DRAFT_510814 [Lenzites betulinus]|nr:hypothetical protein C2E23DRAFT_510814 [Lenzites betulinus]